MQASLVILVRQSY